MKFTSKFKKEKELKTLDLNKFKSKYNGLRHCHCLLLFSSRIEKNDSDEDAQVAIEEYNSQKSMNKPAELIDLKNRIRKYFKDGVEKETRLYQNLLRFVRNPDNAYEVWSLIDKLMMYQTDTKGICRPIQAAMSAKVISRPTLKDFCLDFPELEKYINKTDFNVCLRDRDKYNHDEAFEEQLEMFRKIKMEQILRQE